MSWPAATASAAAISLRIGLLGDVMLGRLVDQLMPEHVYDPEDGPHARYFTEFYNRSKFKYRIESPWGSIRPLLLENDANFANLETSLTRTEEKWPNKVFNYRAHPKSAIAALKAGKVGYVSCANNHTLDFGIDGLNETVDSLNRAGITFAGIGQTADEAHGAKFLDVSLPNVAISGPSAASLRFSFFSASDHPNDWASVPRFFHLDVDNDPRPSDLASKIRDAKSRSDICVFSLHWGPNYAWQPNSHIRSLAHWLIDQGVDIIHGHSSHHIQGIELYKGKLIAYGLGDFLDDYAVDEHYRNDLSFLYRLHLDVQPCYPPDSSQKVSWNFSHLDLIPTKIKYAMVHRISPTRVIKPDASASEAVFAASFDPQAYELLVDRMKQLCKAVNGGKEIVEEDKQEEMLRIWLK